MPIQATTILETIRPIEAELISEIDKILCTHIKSNPHARKYSVQLPYYIKMNYVITQSLVASWREAGWKLKFRQIEDGNPYRSVRQSQPFAFLEIL